MTTWSRRSIFSRSGRRPAVIVLSGSEGGIVARISLARHCGGGFVTMSLAHFAMDGLPRDFPRIPLDISKKANTGCACIRPSCRSRLFDVTLRRGGAGCWGAFLLRLWSPACQSSCGTAAIPIGR
jgi:hypothetical protein